MIGTYQSAIEVLADISITITIIIMQTTGVIRVLISINLS